MTLKQIEIAIKQLNPREKVKLILNLEKETWPNRFKFLLKRLDRKAPKYPISEKEIDQTCQDVRHKLNAHRSH